MMTFDLKNISKGLNKFSASLLTVFSIFFVVWLLLLTNSKYDGGELFKVFFYDSFVNFDRLKVILLFFAPFLLGSLAVFFCFRSGLINLGVGGQMSIAALSIYFVHHYLKKQEYFFNSDQKLWIPIFFLVGIFAATLLSLFCGVLKAYFGIHEVVSTIFTNFIVFYVYRYLINLEHIINSTKTATKTPVGDAIAFNVVFWLFSVTFVMAIAIFLFMVFIVKKTRFGFQTYIIEKKNKVARYAGINIKHTTLWVFLISGILVGFAGIFYYYRDLDNTYLSKGEAISSYGFDTITITWLAQSSLFGLPFAAFFIAIIRAQQKMIKISNVDPVIVELIMGLLLLSVTFLSKMMNSSKTRAKIKKLLFLNQIYLLNPFGSKIKNSTFKNNHIQQKTFIKNNNNLPERKKDFIKTARKRENK